MERARSIDASSASSEALPDSTPVSRPSLGLVHERLRYSQDVTKGRAVPSAPGISGLKRHPALVPLSRDHHGALVQARALRLAAGGTHAERRRHPATQTARGFLDFHERELRGHIADEERALLPRCKHADPSGAERILAEHRELEALVAAIAEALRAGEDPVTPMAQAGQLLDDHVRFEERCFFEGVQRALSADALLEIGRAIEANRAARGVAGPACALPLRLGDSSDEA